MVCPTERLFRSLSGVIVTYFLADDAPQRLFPLRRLSFDVFAQRRIDNQGSVRQLLYTARARSSRALLEYGGRQAHDQDRHQVAGRSRERRSEKEETGR